MRVQEETHERTTSAYYRNKWPAPVFGITPQTRLRKWDACASHTQLINQPDWWGRSSHYNMSHCLSIPALNHPAYISHLMRIHRASSASVIQQWTYKTIRPRTQLLKAHPAENIFVIGIASGVACALCWHPRYFLHHHHHYRPCCCATTNWVSCGLWCVCDVVLVDCAERSRVNLAARIAHTKCAYIEF